MKEAMGYPILFPEGKEDGPLNKERKEKYHENKQKSTVWKRSFSVAVLLHAGGHNLCMVYR